MIRTDKYCAKTSFVSQTAATAPGVKVCAIDIGYSGVKCFTDDHRACFPSFARQLSDASFVGEAHPNDILYSDERGIWAVGSLAVRGTSIRDTNESEATLYSRDRYDSEMFKVLYRVGMGLCLLNEPGIENGGMRGIEVQTGLPPAYLKSDKRDLVRVLSGAHRFKIKVGSDSWKEIFFDIRPEKVYVMAQPNGALYSASLDNDARQTPDGKQYFRSSILVLDPGFGTCDVFVVRNRMIDSTESFDNLGMKAVYKRLSDRIYEIYGEYIPVHAIPNVLNTGTVDVLDKATVQTQSYPIGDLLKESSDEICKRAIQKLQVSYDYLREFRYLLIAGGTGEAWKDNIMKHFAGIKGLSIILGNQNDSSLPQIFSNVRGYYLYRVGCLRRVARNA